jgi:heterodisulfide reductase subunit A-like polyferredoxin
MIYEKEKRYIIPFDDVPAPRAEMPEIEPDERKGNFNEVETGFPEEIAVREAKRCLSCRRCLGCALCWAECKPEAIDFTIPDQVLDLMFDEVILTRGQDNGFESFNPKLGYDSFADVITDRQFERMLSPAGPTGGLVMSPLDGEVPKRIAIVQGAPQGGEDHLFSSLTFGANASIIALAGAEELEVILVSPICDRFKENSLSQAQAIKGLHIVDGLPESVEKGNDERSLTLTYAIGSDDKEEMIDLVVVLTKSRVAPEIQSLSQKLDIEIPAS